MRRTALLLALLAPGIARADLVYVLNSGDATISVIESSTREEVRRIPVLREVHHLIRTLDGRELMVGDSAANELIFIDPMTAEVSRRERISNPYHLEHSPDGKFLVITSLRRDQVDIYDAATRTLLQRLRVPDKPSHLAFSPDSRMVYVTLQGARRLMAIDLVERQPVWQVEVGSQPAGVIWHRGKLLVGIMGSDHIAVVNPTEQRVERRIPIGRGAHTVFASPDGRALFATSRVDSRLVALDPETLDPTKRWDIPGGPDCIAFDPAGRLWITLRWVARVAVVDPAGDTWDTIAVGRSPHGIAVQPRRDPMAPGPLPESPMARLPYVPEDMVGTDAVAATPPLPVMPPLPVTPAALARPAAPAAAAPVAPVAVTAPPANPSPPAATAASPAAAVLPPAAPVATAPAASTTAAEPAPLQPAVVAPAAAATPLAVVPTLVPSVAPIPPPAASPPEPVALPLPPPPAPVPAVEPAAVAALPAPAVQSAPATPAPALAPAPAPPAATATTPAAPTQAAAPRPRHPPPPHRSPPPRRPSRRTAPWWQRLFER